MTGQKKNNRHMIHVIAHILTAIACSALIYPLTIERAIIAGIAGLLPDTDTYLDIPHRGVTHSVLAIAGVYIIAWSTSPPDPAIPAIAAIAYTSHIALDLLHSIAPIQVAWPAKYMASIQQIHLPTTTAAIIAAGIILVALYHPTPARALFPTPPPTPKKK